MSKPIYLAVWMISRGHADTYTEAMQLEEVPFALCEFFNEAVGVDVHHIIPRGMGGSRIIPKPEELILLSRGAHDLAEAKKLTPKELQLAAIRAITRPGHLEKDGRKYIYIDAPKGH